MKIFWFMTFHTKLCLVQNHCKFDEVDGFIRVCYGTRYLTLFDSKKNDFIDNGIRYLFSEKNCITYVFSQCYAKIELDSYDYFPLTLC